GDAVGAVRGVVVGREVRVREVETGVDVTDDDRRASACDRVRLGDVDLAHVTLQWTELVGVCHRGARGDGRISRVRTIQLVLTEAARELRGRHRSLHAFCGRDVGGEVAPV